MNLLDEMMKFENDDLELIVQRDVQSQSEKGLDYTFSAEAMDSLQAQMITFVGSRMMRYHDQTGLMPQNLRVRLTVEVSA